MSSAAIASLPHLFTGLRIACGAAAIVTAGAGRLWLAATCIVVGAAADGIDGQLARRTGTSSTFGALFDYFADYLCFVVAPWSVSRALVSDGTLLVELLLGLPLLTAAIRYAQNGAAVASLGDDAPDLPGLGTVFCGFVSVTAVFLDAEHALPASRYAWGLTTAIAILAILMVVPVRYPKLSRFRGASPRVLALLVLMPFAGTRVLAVIAVVVGLGYALLAPLAAKR